MKPLTREELKALPDGEYFWIVELNGMYVRKVGCTEEYIVVDAMPVFDEFKFTDYGTKWVAYKNKEQAEAKGEIVELYCKTDDTVYMPWVWDGECDVATLTVKHIDMQEDGQFRLYFDLDTDIVEYEMEYREHLMSNFGKTWFTDKNEAEKKLAELKGESQ